MTEFSPEKLNAQLDEIADDIAVAQDLLEKARRSGAPEEFLSASQARLDKRRKDIRETKALLATLDRLP
jgi:flagellar motility protein MotE (MotC chaperone)